ncbi:hypothetical protein CSE16_17130 [Solibacillus sp. R5-41]|uniref:phosphoribosyltransferase family protein n=1 Tax=Solibacillus sp. R5-41 TaxID=2048654 RepID=UPI000C128291|nr:phosphoribosyltransferase family protein [Solibacillus sp. R5-41]ATP41619.1 hypothetical protein CSE16_17130 [Solibacillus sp. R5-41]
MSVYNLLNKLTAEVNITANRYEFEPSHFFDMALRINKNRSFLFVSKVLGKHLAVAPQIPILTGYLLAHYFLETRQHQQQETTATIIYALKQHEKLQQTLQEVRTQPIESKKPLTIIGFAETATALGHAFFEAFTGDARYIHTTREQLVDCTPIITFEEEHSHASSHRLYADPTFFDGESEVVLVDDEMTTGKTNRNIIKQIHTAYPHIKVYTLVAILDWRNDVHKQAFADLANELNIEIHSVALMQGDITIKTTGELPEAQRVEYPKVVVDEDEQVFSLEQTLQNDLVKHRTLDEQNGIHQANYYKGSGRFALNAKQQVAYYERLNFVIENLNSMRTGEKCLVLGTGEFMYTPMYIAAQLDGNVFYHSTTRSPIYAHEDSLIYHKMLFKSPEYPGVPNYLYNIRPEQYDDIFLIFERILDEEALLMVVKQLQRLAKNVQIVVVGGDSYANL